MRSLRIYLVMLFYRGHDWWMDNHMRSWRQARLDMKDLVWNRERRLWEYKPEVPILLESA